MTSADPVAGPVEVLVLADTHAGPGTSRRLPDAVYEHLADVDLVLHAGDVVEAEVLDELAGFAPVRAVLGNNDRTLFGVLPETRLDDIGGLRVGMVHDSGPRAGRAARLRRTFPDADLVIFGHSHLPCNEAGLDGQRLFNPGSATWKRQAPTHTVGRLTVAGGHITRLDVVDV